MDASENCTACSCSSVDGTRGVGAAPRYQTVLSVFFHMSGKSQTIGDFTVSLPSQILPRYREIARRLSQILGIHRWQTPYFLSGGGRESGELERSNLEDW